MCASARLQTWSQEFEKIHLNTRQSPGSSSCKHPRVYVVRPMQQGRPPTAVSLACIIQAIRLKPHILQKPMYLNFLVGALEAQTLNDMAWSSMEDIGFYGRHDFCMQCVSAQTMLCVQIVWKCACVSAMRQSVRAWLLPVRASSMGSILTIRSTHSEFLVNLT